MKWKKEGGKLAGAKEGLGAWEGPKSLEGHVKLYYALKSGVYFHAIKTWKGHGGNKSPRQCKKKNGSSILILMKSTFINEKIISVLW